jgi:hypothetical protein
MIIVLALGGSLDVRAMAPLPTLVDRPIGWEPATDGDFVVWIEYGSSMEPDRYAVWAANLLDGESFAVKADTCGWPSPRVSGGVVVWHETLECDEDVILTHLVVRGMDLRTREEFEISIPNGSAALGSLDAGHLVWWAFDDETIGGSSRMMLQFIVEDDDPVVLLEFDQNDDNRPHANLVLSGDRMVFTTNQPDGWRLNLWRIGDPEWTVLAEGDRWDLFSFDFAGDIVVYASHWAAHVIDVSTMETRVLPGRARNPTTDGRYVFWEDTRFIIDGTDTDESRVDIWGYDLLSDSSFPVVKRQSANWEPFARNFALVWTSGAVRRWHVGPSRPHPHPGKTDPNWFYFSETGHYLSYGFKDFWVRSGGLPVFGFPLTTEYDELNRDLNEFRTVQYTERQRFEYHPDLAGTPYETLLGRLGAEDAKRRGLDDHPAFAKVADPRTAGVEYFAATGHTVRGRFRDYWHSHGLDFGDPGVSFRESLALFGYPISEEFIDPGTGLTTQYFERAVFEYHPDNPDPYKVLLRRIGAEEIDNRAW